MPTSDDTYVISGGFIKFGHGCFSPSFFAGFDLHMLRQTPANHMQGHV